MRLTCRQCRALLPGYIQRELTPKQRERVSLHLSACSECYGVYTAQREIVRELAISVPRIGSDHPPLEEMRAAVMAEMARPRVHRPLDQARYSLVALALVVALLLPVTFRTYSAPLATQQRPINATPQGTLVIAVPTTETATLTATLQSNYAPLVSATDTP